MVEREARADVTARCRSSFLIKQLVPSAVRLRDSPLAQGWLIRSSWVNHSSLISKTGVQACAQKGLSLTIVERRPRQLRKRSSARRSAVAALPMTRTEIGWPTPGGT